MQERRRLRQDATPTDQTQGPLLLMMEVVARKVMREVPRETMIPGMWVQGGVVAVVVGW